MFSGNTMPRNSDIHVPSASTWECVLLGFSGLLAFVAWDNNFNMQVLAPTTILLAIGYFVKTRGTFADKKTFQICMLILGICAIGMLCSLILDSDMISVKSIVRFCYVIIILLFYYVTVSKRYAKREIRLLISGNIIAGTLISIGVILRYLGGASGKIAITNIWGIPLEENYMASLLAFEFVLSAATVRYTRNIINKIILLLASALLLTGILLSGSRAALLGALIGTALLLVSYLIDGTASAFIARLAMLLLLVLGAYFAARMINSAMPTWYLDRYFHNSYLDSSNIQRLNYWSFGIQGYLDRPLFGYGVGNYAYYVDMQTWSGGGDIVVAHNTYIDALVDVGILGFSLFVILIARNFKSGWKSASFIALFAVALFTSFIVGGERTFFFWNSVVMLSIFAKYAASYDNPAAATEKLFDLSHGLQGRIR